MTDNIYKPHVMRIEDVRAEAPDVSTFRLAFLDPALAKDFNFAAGQFGEFSAFGSGESTFCIASSPTRLPVLECTFRKAGRNTTALAMLNKGDEIGFRGPYGNVFPLDKWAKKDIVFVAGGIGLPPMRCLIQNVLDLRDRFGKITIVYGARTVADMVYKGELEEWNARPDVALWRCIDWKEFGPDGPIAAAAEKGWEPLNTYLPAQTKIEAGAVRKFTGFVPQLAALAVSQGVKPSNTVAVICGPPVMIRYTLPVLLKLGVAPGDIYTTLENRMKCGVGKCGRCNVGGVYVCKEGPVFTAAQISKLPAEY